MLVDLRNNELAMWVVCEAVGAQRELIDKMESIEGEGIIKDIKFTVGGVELNFLNVIEAISNNFDAAVNKRAQKLIKNKFDNLIETIDDIKDDVIEKLNHN